MGKIRELRSLTGVRGVAAVYVVMFHYMYLGEPKSFPTTFLDHGYLAVDLFFVLSGFVMALNYAAMFDEAFSFKAFSTFLGRRIARVYPLYFVCTVLALALILKGWIDFKDSPLSLWPSFLANLFMVQSWGLSESLDIPAWSISAEWAAYLLFPLLLRVAYKASTARTLTAAGASLLVLIALALIHEHWIGVTQRDLDFAKAMYAGPVVRCLAEFTLGLVAARIFIFHKSWIARAPRWMTDAIAVVILILLGFHHSDVFIVMLIPGLILGLASTSSVSERILSSSICHHLGLLSYSIYLVHDLMWGVVRWTHAFANSKGLNHGQTYGVLTAMVVSYGVSAMAYRLLEKPARRWMRVLFEGRSRLIEQTSPIQPQDRGL